MPELFLDMSDYGSMCLNLSEWLLFSEAAYGGVLWKKVFLKILQNSLENTCARVSLLKKLQAFGCSFIKKETLVQVFSCEFRETFKNTFFTEDLRATASVFYIHPLKFLI